MVAAAPTGCCSAEASLRTIRRHIHSLGMGKRSSLLPRNYRTP